MSKQYPGGIVSKTPVTPTSLSAPGIWTMNQQAAAQATNTWPFPRDPQFNYVTMLLHGDGSAGSVAMGSGAGTSSTVTNFNADASTNNFNVVINGDAKSNNFNPYLGDGYYSNYCGTSNNFYMNGEAGFAFGSSADFTIQFWFFANTISADVVFYDGRPTTTQGSYPTIYLNGTTKVVSYVTTSAERITGTTAISVGTWYNVVLSRVSGTTRLFVNGTSQGSWADTTTYANPASRPNICVSGYAANGYLDGYISNLSVLNGTGFTTVTVPTAPSSTSTTNQILLLGASNRFIDSNTATTAKTVNVTGSPQVSPAIPFTLPTTVATYGSGYFDGSGDYLSLTPTSALNLSTNSWTIEMWVNLTTVSANQIFINFGYEGSTQRSFILYLTSANVLQFAYSTNGSNNTDTSLGASGITIGTWNHLAVVRNSTTITVYRNGVAYGTTITIGASAINYTPGAFRIGFDSSNYINGYMTDCRLVNGTAVYTASFTPPTAPLTAITNTQLLTTQYNGGGNNSGFKDSSQFNFPITRNGNTTQGTFTPYGSNWSNFFDGSTGYLSMASNAALNFGTGDATVEFWFNGNTASLLYPGIFSAITYNNAGAASIRYNNTGYANKVFMYINTGGDPVIASTSTIAFGVWAHIAIVRQSTSLKLYLNGTLDTTVTISSGLGFDLSNGGTRIGRGFDVDSTNGYFTGYLSNLRAVKGTAVYTSNFTPSTTPLTAITNTSLLTCQSNRFVDNSASPLTLTVNGSPSVQRFSPFAPLTVYNPTTYGGSAYFDGSGDYLVAAYNAAFNFGTGPFTIETWFYSTANNTYQAIVGIHNGDAGWILRVDSGLRVMFYTGSAEWFGTITMPINTWNHIAIVREGTGTNQTKMYVNGVLDQSMTLTANYTQTNQLSIGAQQNNLAATYLNGWMSNLRVVKNSAVYTSAFTPSTTPLTAITGTSLLLSTTNPAILDNAMLNNLETVGNAAVSTSVKKYGAASMYFDGSGDWLMTPNRTNLNVGSGDFTVEAWVYTGSTSQQVIIGANRNSDGVGAFMLNLNYTGKVRFFCSYSGGTILDYNVGSGTISDSAWHHIAVTRSGSSLRIFIDGTQTGTTNTTLGTASIDNAIADYRVGSTTDGALNFNGYIDDLRITKYARYTTTFTVPDQAFPNG